MLAVLITRSLGPCRRAHAGRRLPSLTEAGFKGLCLQSSAVPPRGDDTVILPVLALSHGTAPLLSAFVGISAGVWGARYIAFAAQFLLTLRLGCRFHTAPAAVPLWFRGVQLLWWFLCVGLITRCSLLGTRTPPFRWLLKEQHGRD